VAGGGVDGRRANDGNALSGATARKPLTRPTLAAAIAEYAAGPTKADGSPPYCRRADCSERGIGPGAYRPYDSDGFDADGDADADADGDADADAAAVGVDVGVAGAMSIAALSGEARATGADALRATEAGAAAVVPLRAAHLRLTNARSSRAASTK
jgi:hypothetical protein